MLKEVSIEMRVNSIGCLEGTKLKEVELVSNTGLQITTISTITDKLTTFDEAAKVIIRQVKADDIMNKSRDLYGVNRISNNKFNTKDIDLVVVNSELAKDNYPPYMHISTTDYDIVELLSKPGSIVTAVVIPKAYKTEKEV